eukprot:TRINITY_DN8465_c0_g1_i1.p1 TRINITY_DN8465_c0_g1~~TRINITY_DN8465_c0_g1_i1.p1  ORF type:complete len:129 (+),score=16.49 TRINITY_DN8465_c0_g1_i1:185-571(+)
MLWDTMGAEDYDNLRPLSYPQTDFALVCVSLVNRASLEAAQTKFVPEIQHHMPHVPFLLVGTKDDLVNDEATLVSLKEKGSSIITLEELQAAAKQLGAIDAITCSAVTMHNVREVFQRAINRTVFTHK